MTPYWSDERGRYGTGESYDWFPAYEDGVETFESEDGLWICTNLTDGVEILRYDGNEVNITVPSQINGQKVVSLNSTFDGFYELKSVVVPEGVTSIEGAFYGCERLEKVSLPKSIVNMCYAFNCCYSLKEIDIPDGVKNVSWAFECTGLKKIRFPYGTENIARAFMGCEELKYAYIPGTVTDMMEAFADCENLSEVVIEDGVTNIGDYAFFNCLSLKELTIPESVTEFGEESVGIMEIREYLSPGREAFRVKGCQIIPGFKIKGKAGSRAEEYAKTNGIEFVRI